MLQIICNVDKNDLVNSQILLLSVIRMWTAHFECILTASWRSILSCMSVFAFYWLIVVNIDRCARLTIPHFFNGIDCMFFFPFRMKDINKIARKSHHNAEFILNLLSRQGFWWFKSKQVAFSCIDQIHRKYLEWIKCLCVDVYDTLQSILRVWYFVK